MEKIKRFKKFSAFNALMWSASLAIIAGAVGVAIVVFGPIDVLKNWKTSVGGENRTFVAGQIAYFESQSEKLVSVPGTADRQLICDAKGTLIEREIVIDSIDLKRPAGVNPLRKNGLNLPTAEAFKDQQGNQTLPRVCRIHFNACYEVYGFREHCEESETEKFTVIEKAIEGVDTDNSDEISDIPQTAPTPSISRGNVLQPSSNPSVPEPQAPVINRTENNTTNNNTTVEAKPESCVVNTNLLGLVPVKLICQ